VRQIAFLLVGTLVLWYLGHYTLNALLMVVAPDLPAAASRALDLFLIPLSALITWLAMRRLEPGNVRPDMRKALSAQAEAAQAEAAQAEAGRSEAGAADGEGREPERGAAGQNDSP